MNIAFGHWYHGHALITRQALPCRHSTAPHVPRNTQLAARNSHQASALQRLNAPNAASARHDEHGIALIMVMIAIFVLTVLAGGFAYSMKVETRLAQNANSEADLEWLGRSGVEYARWVLALSTMDSTQPYDSLNQPWATGSGLLGPTNAPLAEVENPVRLPNGSFTWKITDLESKASINSADEGTLQRALMVMGVDAGEQPLIIGSILDWIDPDDATHVGGGAESDFYKGMDPPYVAKDGPIDDLTELLLVRGIAESPELYWGGVATNHYASRFQPQHNRFSAAGQAPFYPVGLADLFTALSVGKININTASPYVLQLLPGVTPEMAQAIYDGHQGDAGGMPMSVTGPYPNVQAITRCPNVPFALVSMLQPACDIRSRTFQVEVEAEVGGYKRKFVAILGRNGPKDVQILNFYGVRAGGGDPDQKTQ